MPVEFTLEFVVQSGNNNQYRSFISDLRERLKDGSTHNVPALPFAKEKPTRFFDLVIRANDQTVRFRFRGDNLYLLGYQMANGQWLEFDNDAKTHIITEAGTKFLGFDGGYGRLTTVADMTMENITFGSPQLTTAIQSLATSTEGKIRAQKLLIVIVMFCEATRLKDIQDFVAQKYVEGAQTEKVTKFVGRYYTTGAKAKNVDKPEVPLITFEKLVRLWNKLSERLFYDDAFPDGKKQPLKEWKNPLDVVAVLGIALRYIFKPSIMGSPDAH